MGEESRALKWSVGFERARGGAVSDIRSRTKKVDAHVHFADNIPPLILITFQFFRISIPVWHMRPFFTVLRRNGEREAESNEA